ncbi:MAG: VWA domain-containing protein [Acidobacteria bacterium]|nr:VWA domain-containing protein [Acidobacteriota bacterium]
MKRSHQFRLMLVMLLAISLVLPAFPQSGRKTRPRETQSTTRDNGRQGDNQTTNQDKPLADNTPTVVGDDGTIRLDTTLVTVPVSVIDRDGKFVPFLKKSDFTIFEDDMRQEIENFESVEVPFNVVLMMDTSNSTQFKLEDIQAAAVSFVRQLRPDDRVMVVSFDSQVRIICDFTSDRYELRDAIFRTRPGGSTKLYEAVDMVVDRLEEVQGRKAIVIFTDGVDTTSKRNIATAESTLEMAEESGALVYPIRYDTEESLRRGRNRGYPGGVPPIINIPLPRRRSGRFPPLAVRQSDHEPVPGPVATGEGSRHQLRRLSCRSGLPAGSGRSQRRTFVLRRESGQCLECLYSNRRRTASSVCCRLLSDQLGQRRLLSLGQGEGQ